MSAASWWVRHPDLAPDSVRRAQVLFDQKGEGDQSWPVVGTGKYDKVIVVITCNAATHYRVELGSAVDPDQIWTEGDSCGGPNINTYESPAIDRSSPPVTVHVTAPANTKYFVTLYGLTAAKPLPTTTP
ncbi:hypothetical protein [Allocatelliglobosispora scoriae]|uniref:hypothetical protein n=1 Tax=Allocatelliglobosispora scoriae TaxID=643052 RepID=UPI001C87A817|nr:hypothetical protein [Allocatelliglobosispora scoriae]